MAEIINNNNNLKYIDGTGIYFGVDNEKGFTNQLYGDANGLYYQGSPISISGTKILEDEARPYFLENVVRFFNPENIHLYKIDPDNSQYSKLEDDSLIEATLSSISKAEEQRDSSSEVSPHDIYEFFNRESQISKNIYPIGIKASNGKFPILIIEFDCLKDENTSRILRAVYFQTAIYNDKDEQITLEENDNEYHIKASVFEGDDTSWMAVHSGKFIDPWKDTGLFMGGSTQTWESPHAEILFGDQGYKKVRVALRFPGKTEKGSILAKIQIKNFIWVGSFNLDSDKRGSTPYNPINIQNDGVTSVYGIKDVQDANEIARLNGEYLHNAHLVLSSNSYILPRGGVANSPNLVPSSQGGLLKEEYSSTAKSWEYPNDKSDSPVTIHSGNPNPNSTDDEIPTSRAVYQAIVAFQSAAYIPGTQGYMPALPVGVLEGPSSAVDSLKYLFIKFPREAFTEVLKSGDTWKNGGILDMRMSVFELSGIQDSANLIGTNYIDLHIHTGIRADSSWEWINPQYEIKSSATQEKIIGGVRFYSGFDKNNLDSAGNGAPLGYLAIDVTHLNPNSDNKFAVGVYQSTLTQSPGDSNGNAHQFFWPAKVEKDAQGEERIVGSYFEIISISEEDSAALTIGTSHLLPSGYESVIINSLHGQASSLIPNVKDENAGIYTRYADDDIRRSIAQDKDHNIFIGNDIEPGENIGADKYHFESSKFALSYKRSDDSFSQAGTGAGASNEKSSNRNSVVIGDLHNTDIYLRGRIHAINTQTDEADNNRTIEGVFAGTTRPIKVKLMKNDNSIIDYDDDQT